MSAHLPPNIDGGSNLGANNSQTDLSAKHSSGSAAALERPAVPKLHSVFVPSCKGGTVIYPDTTLKTPMTQRRTSIVPPAPATTLHCTLLSRGDDETMTWAPQASPVFRRPSRCMSLDKTVVQSHSHGLPKAVEEAVSKRHYLAGVFGRDSNFSAGEPFKSSLPQDLNLGHPAPPDSHRSAPSTSSKTQGDIASIRGPPFFQSEQTPGNPGRHGYMLWGKPHGVMQGIMAKVRNHLAGHRKPDSVLPREANLSAMCPRSSCQYILSDAQVQDVVEIVFQEMCKHGAPFQDPQAVGSQQTTGNAAHTRLIRKPSCLKNAIEPQSATKADPKITLSEPKPSFYTRSTSDGQVRSRTMSQQIPFTTTVYRNNRTNHRWYESRPTGKSDLEPVNDAPQVPRTTSLQPSSSIMLNPNATNEASRLTSTQTVRSDSETPDFHGFSLGSHTESAISLRKENINESGIDDDRMGNRNMTSFPALPNRQCTNEWISPPASFDARENGTNMYHLGIDARLGSIATIDCEVADEQAVETESRHGIFHGLYNPSATNPSRRASDDVRDVQPYRKDTSSLASAEGEIRRSAHFIEPRVRQHPDLEPGFMQKLSRKISSVFQGNTESRRPTRAPAPSEADGQVSVKFAEALSACRPGAGGDEAVNGYLSEPEHDAVYQAMTLSKPDKGTIQRRSIVLEGNITHTCEDELGISGLPSPSAQSSP
ncbi:hypothetical protein CTA2_9531 [Colletotrichum tanaceti]|uniref:Uncharacterized protein n=1 Tax=Colletotrichum tanaceti TaxID=1306861 RepID=A0A4V6DG50_9PEZI|nr:hypothetical protein CTA2_9531 [Colletotrichum tanaceti]TKW51526.1 hypothetical protein CTA1_1308 [Colletotrichum tanaceti]